jgi:glutamine amidotransferase
MTTVAIVDFGMGNLDSVARAVDACGGTPIRLVDPDQLVRADRIILPGVGAFARGMAQLREHGWDQALAEHVLHQGKPLLGICLGMQVLAQSGDEGGTVPGLGWIPGHVIALRAQSPAERIPHVGWNDLECQRAHPLWEGLPARPDFYFVHSYHMVCADEGDVIARCGFAGGFTAAIGHGPVLGVQFHPEKSQRLGFQVLGNFLALTG